MHVRVSRILRYLFAATRAHDCHRLGLLCFFFVLLIVALLPGFRRLHVARVLVAGDSLGLIDNLKLAGFLCDGRIGANWALALGGGALMPGLRFTLRSRFVEEILLRATPIALKVVNVLINQLWLRFLIFVVFEHLGLVSDFDSKLFLILIFITRCVGLLISCFQQLLACKMIDLGWLDSERTTSTAARVASLMATSW